MLPHELFTVHEVEYYSNEKDVNRGEAKHNRRVHPISIALYVDTEHAPEEENVVEASEDHESGFLPI